MRRDSQEGIVPREKITWFRLGLGISDKKIIPRKTEQTEQMVISDGIPDVPRKRKTRNPFRGTKIEANSHNSVPNPSAEEKTTRNSIPNHSAEENTTRNSFPCNKKQKQSLGTPSEEKPTQIKTRQPNISKIVPEKTTFDVQTNHFVKLFCCCFVNLIFPRNSIPFRSVPSFGIGSSVEFGRPRNECFLPRNNGNRSESIPRNFFGTKFRSQP